MTRQSHWDVQRAEQARWRFDDVRDRVDDTHGRGRHGGPARTVTFGFAERQLAVDVRIAYDVDAVGRLPLRTRPLGCDVARHPDDVLDHDGLPAVDDARGAGPHRTTGTGRDGAECHFDVTIGQLPIERTAYFVDLDAETLRHQVYRCFPGHFDESRSLEHRLEVERTTTARPLHQHGGGRIVVVQRTLAGRDAADVLRLGGQQQRELIGGETREDARCIEQSAPGL